MIGSLNYVYLGVFLNCSWFKILVLWFCEFIKILYTLVHSLKLDLTSAKFVSLMSSASFTFFTDCVRSTTGRLCFDTCLSVCPQGGTPTRSSKDGVPPARCDGGYLMGVPLLAGMGYPLSRGTPRTGQQWST